MEVELSFTITLAMGSGDNHQLKYQDVALIGRITLTPYILCGVSEVRVHQMHLIL